MNVYTAQQTQIWKSNSFASIKRTMMNLNQSIEQLPTVYALYLVRKFKVSGCTAAFKAEACKDNIVINIGKWFAAEMAKEVGAGLLKKIPLAGGLLADTILGTGLTKSSFAASCGQLKDVLRDTYFTRGDIPGKQESAL